MRLSLGLGRDNTRIFWAMIFNEGSLGLYTTLWPIYIASLGASPAQIGLVIGVMGLARIVFLLPSGMLSDRVPPRTLIVGGRAMVVVGFLLFAVARDWWHLLPAAMVAAAGTVAFPAISNTIAENAGNGHQRTRAFTVIYSIGPAGAYLLTPTLGGIIAAEIGLRAMFVGAAILATASVLCFSTISPGRPATTEELPPTYRSVLRERSLVTLLSLQFAMILVLTIGITLVPNFLQEVHGISIERIGQFGSLAAIGSAVIGIASGRIAWLRPPLRAVALSTTAVGGMMLLMLVGNTVWIFGLAYLLRGGFMVGWSAFYSALGEVAPDRIRARVYAVSELMAAGAMGTAPFVAGWLYGVGPRMPLMVGLLLAVPLLVGLDLARRRTQPAATVAPALVE